MTKNDNVRYHGSAETSDTGPYALEKEEKLVQITKKGTTGLSQYHTLRRERGMENKQPRKWVF